MLINQIQLLSIMRPNELPINSMAGPIYGIADIFRVQYCSHKKMFIKYY